MSNIDFEFTMVLAQAAHDAYVNSAVSPVGYTFAEQVEDHDTGFSVTVYRESSGNNYIFAFRGTEQSAKDVFSDFTLGMTQWSKNFVGVRELVKEYIDEDSNAVIHFTGHSLGGALAQYAAYEYALGHAMADPNMAAPFDLVTFNALGGELALKNPDLYPPGYDESIAETINATHYKITGDVFSQLGDDHIGGELFSIDRPINTPLGAHPIAHFTTGVSGAGPVSASEYQNANIEESYLNIGQAVNVSGVLASYGDDGQYTEEEALLRSISAFAFGVAQAKPSELSALVVAFFGDTSTFGVEKHDAMVLVGQQTILALQNSKLGVVGANGIAAYALTLANILQYSTQYWAENPDFADAVGMSIESFIEYVGKPAAEEASGALEYAIGDGLLESESGDAVGVIATAREWIGNYIFGQPTNEMYIQGTESDDVLAGKEVYWPWETRGDQIFGWAGDDLLEGGEGSDYLDGGAGADSFIWNTGDGNDVIGDYDDGGDRIIVNGIDLGLLSFTAAYANAPFYRGDQHPDISLHYAGDFLTVNIDSGADKGQITVTQYSRTTGADYGIVLNDYPGVPAILPDHSVSALGSGVNQTDPSAYWREQSSQAGLNWSQLAIHFDAVDVANYSGGNLHGTLAGAFEGGQIADHLIGDTNGNALHGLAGADQLEGNAGHDFLEGGAGSDNLAGGDGSDILFGSARAGLSDTLASASAHDQFYLAQITDGLLDVNVLDGGAGNDYLSGGEFGDYLSGGTGINYLLGGTGRDHISGGAEQDVIYGDSALNYRYVELSPGVVTERLEIAFADGTDTVGEYDDTVFAGDGNDIVWGELGDDELHGEDGDDNLLGDRYNDTSYFGAELPAYGLTGAELDAALHGDDRLYGGAGSDLLMGMGGDDMLAGGRGNDSLLGGAGDDVYFFEPGDGLDYIEDVDGSQTLLFSGVDISDLQVLFQGDQVWVGSGIGAEGFRFSRDSWASMRLALGTAEAIFDRGRIDSHYLDAAGNVLISLQGSTLTTEADRDALFSVDTSNPDSPGIIFRNGVDQAEIVTNADGSATLQVLGHSLSFGVTLAARQVAGGLDFLALDDGVSVPLVQRSELLDASFHDTRWNDVFDGGSGSDLFYVAGRGDDVLRFHEGDGQDRVYTENNYHPEHMGTVSFAADVDLASLSYTFQNGGAVIAYGNGDQLTLNTDTVFSFRDNVLNRFTLVSEADPDWIPLIQAQGYVGNFYGSYGADHIVGGPNLETILPGYGDDIIAAGGNPDRIVLNDVYMYQGTSGIGHKHISGDGDNDTVETPLHQGLTFHYQPGDGHDTIDYDWSYSRQHPYAFAIDYAGNTAEFVPHGQDVLAFGPGVELADLRFIRMGDALSIALSDGSGSIQLPGFFHAWDASPASGSIDVEALFGEGSSLDSLLNPDVLALLPRTPLAALAFADGSSYDMATLLENYLEFSSATLLGTEGDDDLYGTLEDDVIHALGGNDSIEDFGGSNTIIAGSGNDRIVVGGESDIDPGPGDDVIDVVAGTSLVHFGPGSGRDFTMLDVDAGTVVVAIADGLTEADIQVTLAPMEWGESPMITLAATGDSIVLAGLRYQAESEFVSGDTQGTGFAIRFADGTVIEGGEILALAQGVGGEVIVGTKGKDVLTGTAGDDSISGEKGRDTISGLAGNDVIAGGKGKDTLSGGPGNDSYLFAAGHGRDVIRNDDADLQSLDTLSLDDIAVDDVWLSRNRRHLFLNVAGTMDRIKIDNWYKSDAAQLDEIRAGDYVLLRDQVDQLVNAMAAFDVPEGVGVIVPEQVRLELEPTLASVWQLAG